MRTGREWKRYTVGHPYDLKVEDYLSFVHHPNFTHDWSDLRLNDDDLAELELCVMISPTTNPIVRDTGGIRVIHVQPEPMRHRPSFEAVVYYVAFENRSIAVFLAAEFSGSDAAIADEDRYRLRTLIEEIEVEL